METASAHELRRAGLRVTRPRLSVLSVLAGRPHADADSIVTARGLHPTLSPQAVHGVLEALVSADLARRMNRPARPPSARTAGTTSTTSEEELSHDRRRIAGSGRQ